jgi:predicted nucleic acid-binding Zn ribbon protein
MRTSPKTGDNPVDSVDSSAASGGASTDPPPGGQPRGADIARAALDAARAARTTRAPGPDAPVRRPVRWRPRGWSGARPDDRDPQPLGALAARLVTERGWAARVAAGVVFGRWAQLVGEDLAQHAQPVALRDGELTVQASSTAWATQLRLLQRQLLARIAAGAGPGVVTRLRVQGPAAPSWRHGTRHVSGRGPRDTYG